MKHSDKDIEAAKSYYLDIANELDNEIAFLAGCEHKQEGMDELVEALKHTNMALRAWCPHHSQLIKNNELIQKYKR